LILTSGELVIVTLTGRYVFKRGEVKRIELVKVPLSLISTSFQLNHTSPNMPELVFFTANWGSVDRLLAELKRLNYPLVQSPQVMGGL